MLLAAAAQPKLKAALGLDDSSRVVVVICEGATDPERGGPVIVVWAACNSGVGCL